MVSGPDSTHSVSGVDSALDFAKQFFERMMSGAAQRNGQRRHGQITEQTTRMPAHF